MQLMRQDMEIRRYIFSLLLQFVHSVPNFAGQIIMLSSKLVESDCQECESLVDVVVKLSGYTGAFLLLCFNQLFGHAGECLFHLFAVRNVLGEDENPSGQPVATPPRTNLPADPRSAVLTIPTIFVGSQCFSLKTTAVHFLPVVGNVREKFVVRASQYLRTVH